MYANIYNGCKVNLSERLGTRYQITWFLKRLKNKKICVINIPCVIMLTNTNYVSDFFFSLLFYKNVLHCIFIQNCYIYKLEFHAFNTSYVVKYFAYWYINAHAIFYSPKLILIIHWFIIYHFIFFNLKTN